MQTNTTTLLQRIKTRIQKAVAAVTPGQATLKAAGKGILAAMLLFFILSLGNMLIGNVGFAWFLAGLLCYLLVALLVAWLLSRAVRLLARTPGNFRTALAFVLVSLLFLFHLSGLYGWIIVGMVVIFPALVFGALHSWRAQRGAAWPARQRAITRTLLGIGIAGISASLYLFLYAGTPVKEHIKNYKMLARLPEPLQAANPAQPGSYKVGFLTYGSGTDKRRAIYGRNAKIKTPSVDASFMLKSWKGLSGKLRTLYFGFDQTALPLNAMVWYPENLQGPAPLVIVVHGNHLAQDWSEGGYDYLGKLLASRGYIVASIDENFLNSTFTDLPKAGLRGENGTRGWMMLKHLELWRKWNQDPHNPFYHKIDMDRLAIIGHSRGGEAVSHAALFNTLPCFPDNAGEVFDFNFNIKAYIAIAPVDGQYKPASILAPLKDINYFVIQGTHDMDMQSYGGLSTYKRIEYSPSFNGFKAGLYVQHANHGQFNTSWGRYDGSSPYINQFNMTNLMPVHDQEQIAKVYISAFLDINLKGDTVYKPLFEDYRYGRQWLPKQIYFNQYESSRATFIARYEEDLNLQTAGMPGVSISAKHLSVWREELHKLMWGDHISRAAYIGWNREKVDSLVGQYAFTFPDSTALQLQGRSLVFSMATSDESSLHVEKGKPTKAEKQAEKTVKKEEKKEEKHPEEKQPVDFTLELTDRAGNHIRFPLIECMPLQPQIQKKLTKFAFLNQNDDAESIPDFFYFNLDKLQQQHPEFNMSQLRQLRFIFDRSKSGVIILDDVGFMDL